MWSHFSITHDSGTLKILKHNTYVELLMPEFNKLEGAFFHMFEMDQLAAVSHEFKYTQYKFNVIMSGARDMKHTNDDMLQIGCVSS